MMRRYISTSRIVRRAAALFAFLCALAPFSGVSRAETDAIPAPLAGDCSDDVLRAEIRLCELGYSTRVVNGRWEREDAGALARFALAAGLDADAAMPALFSNGAPAAADGRNALSPLNASSPASIGSLMPWGEVRERLAVGETYGMTGCYSGITLHMLCVSTGNYARMRPALEWDEATLRGFFTGGGSSEKLPVILSLDGMLVAASIQFAPASADEAATFCVFFTGSRSDVNDLPDVEHDLTIAIAGGG